MMEQIKENWILKRINESIEKNGRVDEACLKLLYTQISYHDEFLELLDEFRSIPSVSAYLYMKKTNSCTELLETFENKEKVQTYLYMVNQIRMVDEIMDNLRNGGWCHHILVGNGKKYRCVRCGVTIDSDLDCNNYTITDSLDYNEARVLYEDVISDIEFECVDNIIDGMILVRNEQKVKGKRFY